MLTNFRNIPWWYMEVPRTGSSTVERGLRKAFPEARALYQKHWPILPEPQYQQLQYARSVITIRNPYSRAISCWQFFTVPNTITFLDWLKARIWGGFMDVSIEARPQAFWFNLKDSWDYVIRQESLDSDFWAVVPQLGCTQPKFDLLRYNDINGGWRNRCRQVTSRTQPWQSFYCDESKRLVTQLYAADFYCLRAYYTQEFPDK